MPNFPTVQAAHTWCAKAFPAIKHATVTAVASPVTTTTHSNLWSPPHMSFIFTVISYAAIGLVGYGIASLGIKNLWADLTAVYTTIRGWFGGKSTTTTTTTATTPPASTTATPTN